MHYFFWRQAIALWIWVAINTANAFADDACPDVCLEVSQGARYFGRFSPIATSTSVVDFYKYKHYNFNGDDIVPLVMDQSLVMIHYANSECDLSVVIVHDSKEDSTGGQVHMRINGNHELPLVEDGPGDGSKSDRYLYVPDNDETELFWEWGWQSKVTFRTDGMADAWDSTECLHVSAKFIAGIDAWRFVPGPVNETSGSVDPNDYVFLDKDETLRICKIDCDAPTWKEEKGDYSS